MPIGFSRVRSHRGLSARLMVSAFALASMMAAPTLAEPPAAKVESDTVPWTHFKERYARPVEGTRVAFQMVEAEAAVDLSSAKFAPLRQSMVDAGLDPVTVAPTALPRWYTATLGNVARGGAALRGAVRTLRENPAIEFCGPVVVGDVGPMWPTRHLVVGFSPAARQADRAALLQPFIKGQAEYRWKIMPDTCRVELLTNDGFEALEIAARLADVPDVRFSEVDAIRTVRHEVIPNDPLFSNLWGLHNTGQSGGVADADMDGPEAWDITTGSNDIITVVLDNGIQLSHPDLNLGSGEDFTGSGSGGPQNSCDNHGTPVASCISGRMNNDIGITGIAPGTRVASARVFVSDVPCNGFGIAQDSWVADALDWAVGIGARVSNTSLSLGSGSILEDAYASSRSDGIVHFAASGNDGDNSVSYPARYSSVNAVGALTRTGTRASFSNYGTGLDFSAPGVSIEMCDRTGSAGYSASDYTTANGTSFASPYAAGVAALILSVKPSLTPSQVESIMESTAVDKGDPGYDTEYGHGFVNAYAALLATDCTLGATAAGTMQDLGTLGGDQSRAAGMSADGNVVVGWADDSQNRFRAFRWTAPGGMQNLGTLGGTQSFANAITPDGSVIVGHSDDAADRFKAFRWTSAGGMQNLGTLGGLQSIGAGVSSDGLVVVGAADTSGAQSHAFRWTQAGGMQDLGTLGGTTSEANGTSADGSVVVGLAFNSAGAFRAFRWTAGGGMQNLNTLGGDSSYAYAVSPDGSVVVGVSSNSSGETRGFRWTAATGMQSVGTLGGDLADARGLTADGAAVVGFSRNAAASNRAFTWTAAGGMQNLGTLGGCRSEAFAISSDRRVIAGLAENESGLYRAFRWTATGTMQDLGTFGGPQADVRGVTADGNVVVGWAYDPQNYFHAFRWTATGGMQDLGTLGGTQSFASAITPNGNVIAGWSDDSQDRFRAYRWTQAGGMQELGTLGGLQSLGYGVSGDGNVVVGEADTTGGQRHAFRWTQSGGMQDLGTFGGSTSEASGASADGSVVVGYALNPAGELRAFRWTASGGMQDLGTLGGNLSQAQAVSPDGSVIVGVAHNVANERRAFRWTAAGGMVDLGTLGGDLADARGLTAEGGAVVGFSRNVAGMNRAFMWTSASGMRALGTLGGDWSEGFGISSDRRVVIGKSQADTGLPRAFRWLDVLRIASSPQNVSVCSSATSANFFITAENGAAFQWQREVPAGGNVWVNVLNGATGGYGTVSGATTTSLTISNPLPAASGAFRCVVSGPFAADISTSATLSFACLADYNCSGGRSVQDLFDFLADWFAQIPSADFNNSGTVTVQDLFDFLAAWFAGCP